VSKCVILVSVLLGLFVSIFYTTEASAFTYPNPSKYAPYCDNGNAQGYDGARNASEQRAACYAYHSKVGPQGALWFNGVNDLNASDADYYSTGVKTNSDSDWIYVYIHGSAADYKDDSHGEDFYAIKIVSPDTNRLKIEGGYNLNNNSLTYYNDPSKPNDYYAYLNYGSYMSAHFLYRGKFIWYQNPGWQKDGVHGRFTSRSPDYLNAKLNISDVPRGEKGEISVNICRSGDYSAFAPNSFRWGCETIKVQVDRSHTHNYNLTPTLSVSQKTIDVGENKVAGINASFGHDGSTTKTKNNDKYYTVVKYKVPKGQNLVLPAREGIVTWSDNWPCEAIKNINGAVDCQGDLVKTKHTGELQLNQSVTMLNSHTDDVLSSNLQFGDKICYVAMVSAYNQNANHHTFKTSQAQCVTVGKTPKVQVWGGDIKTDKDVITNKTSSANQNVYGSWGEYGIIPNGKVDSSSGAGLSSSFNGRLGVMPREYNKLTFANTPKFGNFSATNSVPDNFTLPSVVGTRGNISGNVDVDSLASGEYNAGNVTLTGSKLSVGKSIVIKSSGVVRISGDLLYTDTNDVRQLPQLIIYAKNIIIEPSVGEVNAWLITQKDGYVSTCGVVINYGDWLSGVSDASCGKKQLKINGPIKTGRLFLRRTYGGKHASSAKNDPNMHPGTPAEIINLRADTYIWAYNNYRNTSAISTMNVRELPPRY